MVQYGGAIPYHCAQRPGHVGACTPGIRADVQQQISAVAAKRAAEKSLYDGFLKDWQNVQTKAAAEMEKAAHEQRCAKRAKQIAQPKVIEPVAPPTPVKPKWIAPRNDEEIAAEMRKINNGWQLDGYTGSRYQRALASLNGYTGAPTKLMTGHVSTIDGYFNVAPERGA